MLEFRNVTFQYDTDDFQMLRDLSFSLKEGEFVSLVGTSGCGKSTIFRLTNRLLTPNAGEILVGGEDIRKLRSYCGYMPQKDLLLPWRTVRENARLPLEVKGGMSEAEMKTAVDAALEHVGLQDWADKSPAELSGGMRQRVAFARTMLAGSNLMLLDEPFSALDYLTRLSMREWLLNCWELDKKTVLFITHDVEEALFLSGRILVVEERPITKLTSIEVPVGYPRSRDSLNDPRMLELKERLIGMLENERREEVAHG